VTRDSKAATVTRREFLASAGASLSALRLGLGAESRVTNHDSLARIGLQLYTLRNEMRASVDATLARVAQIGYKEVEFAGYFGKTPKQIRALLDANRLTSPSSHGADPQTLRTRWPQALEEAKVVGHRYMVCASLPENARGTVDDYKRAAALLNQRGEEARKVGIRLGYHNHDVEFQPLGGTTGYDVLLAECDPKLVQMQLDLFWIVMGKHDPLAYFTRFPGRFFSVHVKDMNAAGEMVDVGAGRLPFAKYFAAGKKAGVKHYFVEHDRPGDAFASVKASFEHLRKLAF